MTDELDFRVRENLRLREYNSRPEVKELRRKQAKAYRLANLAALKAANAVYRASQRKAKPWQKLLQCARQRASVRGIECSLTPEWAVARYTGRCEMTGIEFRVGVGKSGPQAFSPSIDRIDQSKGYTPENCRFVLFAVNAIRGTMSDADMIMLAKRLAAIE